MAIPLVPLSTFNQLAADVPTLVTASGGSGGSWQRDNPKIKTDVINILSVLLNIYLTIANLPIFDLPPGVSTMYIYKPGAITRPDPFVIFHHSFPLKGSL